MRKDSLIPSLLGIPPIQISRNCFSFRFIALSAGVVLGDVWRGGVAARPRILAVSDFSFIALSSEVVSGAVWGGLSSAML
jgi:hypothetical protein